MQFKAVAPNVFVWLDTCNVYVIEDGASAILIDIGDGLVLDALSQIGVTTVEWVLYTLHHPEQCQGHPQLAGHALASCGVKVAVPANGSESRRSMPYSLRPCTATSFLDDEHVRKTRGAHIWTHQRVVDLIERPLDYDYDAMIPAYRERPTGDIQSLKVDRVVGDGEVIHWRGHEAVVAATPVPSRMVMATRGNTCTASHPTSFWPATRWQSRIQSL